MKGETKNCLICRKKFYVYPSRLGNNFCSRVCANSRKVKRKEVKCKECGKTFFRVPSMMKPIGLNFCSPTCVYKSRKKGIGNYQKVTPKSEIGRHGKRMVQGAWSTKKADLEFSRWTKERDNYTCYFCGKHGNQASHYWGRGKSALRYEPDNVDAICGGCHMRNESNKQGLYRIKKIRQLGQERYDELEKINYQSEMTRREAIIELMQLLGKL